METRDRFDLFDRTESFAINAVSFCRRLPKEDINRVFIKQVIRSTSSVGANYIEANDALGSKDFIMRLRIARKEANESLYWLHLLVRINPPFSDEGQNLIQEAIELKKILSSIIKKKRNRLYVMKSCPLLFCILVIWVLVFVLGILLLWQKQKKQQNFPPMRHNNLWKLIVSTTMLWC